MPSIAAAASSGDKLSRAEGDMTKTLGSDSSSTSEAMPPPPPADNYLLGLCKYVGDNNLKNHFSE